MSRSRAHGWTWGLVAALGPILAASAAGQEGDAAPAGRWEVPAAGLSLPLPAGFERVTGRTGQPLLKRVDPTARYGDNVQVRCEAQPEPATPEELLEAARASSRIVEELEVLTAEVRDVAGIPSAWLEYRGLLEGLRLRWLIVSFMNEGVRVAIVVTGLDRRWDAVTGPAATAALAGLELRPADDAPPPARPRIDYPTFGLSLVPPDGWLDLEPEEGWEVGAWLQVGGGEPRRSLLVEARPKTRQSLPELASDIAQGLGGEVAAVTSLAGAPARLVAPGEGNQPGVGRVLVSLRSGVFYLLVARGGIDDATWDAAIASWRWRDLAPPSEHLELHDQVQPLLEGRFYMNYPRVLRPFEARRQRGSTLLGLHNYARDRTELSIRVALGENTEGRELGDLASEFGARAMAELGRPDAELAWRDAGSPKGVLVSDVVTYSGRGPAGAETEQDVVYGLMRLRPAHFALVNFSIFHEDPAVRARYHELCREVLATVRDP